MGFFHKEATLGPGDANHVKSEASTVVPSQNVSNSNLEKEHEVESTVDEKGPGSTSGSDSTKKMDAQQTETERSPSPENEKNIEEIIPVPENHDGDDEAVYPTGLKLTLIVIALCLSVFLVALDNTIIATAIPKITDRFNSLGDVGWYGSAYLLTTCALQLFFGK